MGSRAGTGRAGVLAIAAAMVALAIVCWRALEDEPVLPGPVVPMWALAVLFAATEVFVVHIHERRQAQTFSFSEIPLVIGLLYESPGDLIVARLVGAGLALVLHRRQPPIKVLFNLSLFALETALGALVFRVVVGNAEPLGPQGWLAASLAALAGLGAGIVAVGCVVALRERIRLSDLFSRAAIIGVVTTLVATDLGLVAAASLRSDLAWWPLLGAGVVAGLGLTAHARLRARHVALEQAYAFISEASASLERGGGAEQLLQHACELLRAEWAELAVPLRDGEAMVVSTRDGRATRIEGPEAAALLRERSAELGSASSVLLRKGRGGDLDDAIVAALPFGTERGTFVVAQRLGDVEPFDEGARPLVESLAAHSGVAVRNRYLLDRLRAEARDREYRSLHDDLTGLPNRRLLDAELANALRRRGMDEVVGVLMIDLDRFKEVNDTLGHHQGDQLLVDVAARVRSLAPPDAILGRIGGDEFAMVLPGRADAAALEAEARRLRQLLSRPFELAQLSLDVGCSIGVAISPLHGERGAVLLQRADVAMYAAKERATGVEFYDPTIDRTSPGRLALVADLRAGIERGEIAVHFQPIVDLDTGRCVGAEALARWYSVRHGDVPPNVFIREAESTGLIAPLTQLVLGRALRQAREWRADGFPIGVSVNLSARDLNDDLPARVEALLHESGLPASTLTLEITETSIMSEPHRTIALVHRLSAMGVRISVDDFGTGYSSLSQLRRLPVDEVKIDQSFVQAMVTDGDSTIVHTIVDLARNLGLKVVAEGVEDAPSWQTLRALGCDHAQGWFVSRARTPSQFRRWLHEQRADGEALDGLAAEEARRTGEAIIQLPSEGPPERPQPAPEPGGGATL